MGILGGTVNGQFLKEKDSDRQSEQPEDSLSESFCSLASRVTASFRGCSNNRPDKTLSKLSPLITRTCVCATYHIPHIVVLLPYPRSGSCSGSCRVSCRVPVGFLWGSFAVGVLMIQEEICCLCYL